MSERIPDTVDKNDPNFIIKRNNLWNNWKGTIAVLALSGTLFGGGKAAAQNISHDSVKAPNTPHNVQPKNVQPKSDPNVEPAGVVGENKGAGPESPGFGPVEQNPNEQGFIRSEIAPANLVYGAVATVEQATSGAVLDSEQAVINLGSPAETGVDHGAHQTPATTPMTSHTVSGHPSGEPRK